MKHLRIILALAIISLAPSVASAHTLVRDGSIGAVLHIAPNDDPRAGDPASIGFSVSDQARQFSARDCSCQLEILKEGRALTTLPLPQSLQATYSFPSTGLYTLRLIGSSNDSSFQPFSIEQSIRVSQVGGAQEWPLSRVASALILSTLLVGVFTATIYYHRKFAPFMNKGETS